MALCGTDDVCVIVNLNKPIINYSNQLQERLKAQKYINGNYNDCVTRNEFSEKK